jgi:hypothetical protein
MGDYKLQEKHPNDKLMIIFSSQFIGLAYQGKDIVFGFIIEYSSLRVYFYMRIFERWYFGLC